MASNCLQSNSFSYLATRLYERPDEMNIAVSQKLRAYFIDENQLIGGSAEVVPLYKYFLAGEQSDDHVISISLSELTFPYGTVALPLDNGPVIYGACAVEQEKDKNERLFDVGINLKSRFTNCSSPILFVPTVYNGHWGEIVAASVNENADATGKILWGDSLGNSAPAGILYAEKDIMSVAWETISWSVVSENFSSDILN